MKKYQKNIIIIGVVFLVIVGLLTYFSSTIDRMLLPQVKVSEPVLSDIEGNTYFINKYLIPKTALTEDGTVYVVYKDDFSDVGTVDEISVQVNAEDDIYYEIQSDHINISQSVIYAASKEFEVGGRVYIAEEA